MAASNSIRSMLMTLLIFAMVLSPILPCRAVRFTPVHASIKAMAAGNSARSVLVSLLIFAMVFSPMLLPCEAARFTDAHGINGVKPKKTPPTVYCLDCVCCEPAPPGQCCKCGC
ncbi:hypothetical protein LWI29_026002 [Acer saccharum]|uniref:Transmembrane protein n=1 Tax=Acer saccharum TaxID=4024 RepID=A0AA39VZ02_ACESA|nr:hypothetical protein LWI29_026002 [Acer saccharum]